jgi:hypothetical protein
VSLSDQLDKDYAPAWRPVPGEKVIGAVTALDAREGAYGTYPIVTLETDDGEIALHCFHEVLQNELAKIAPKIGDRIGVKYVGKHPERGYHVYRVQRDGADDEFAWGQFGADEPAAPPASDVPNDFPAYGEPPAETTKPGGGDDADVPF